MINRHVKIFILAVILVVLLPMPKAHAIDPVTMAVLAPVALKVADAAKPFLVKSAINTVQCLGKMGKDVFEICYLPYGLCKMSLGAPFGGFSSGFVYTIKGGIAPGKLVFHTLMLPVSMIGIDINVQ